MGKVPWSSLLSDAFRDGEHELPLRKLRKRVLKAAVAACEEAGVEAPEECALCGRVSVRGGLPTQPVRNSPLPPPREELQRKFITKVTFSERFEVDGDTVRLLRRPHKKRRRSTEQATPAELDFDADEEEEEEEEDAGEAHALAVPAHEAGEGAGGKGSHRHTLPSHKEWTTSQLPQRWGAFRCVAVHGLCVCPCPASAFLLPRNFDSTCTMQP